jgi:hypothetical protein
LAIAPAKSQSKVLLTEQGDPEPALPGKLESIAIRLVIGAP